MKPEFYKTFNFLFGTAVLAVASAAFLVVTFERPPTTEVQMGFRGTAMELVYNDAELRRVAARNIVPEALEAVEDDPDSPRASEVYENVQLLGHLSVEQFGRIMQAMTNWIYPNPENPAEGCNGCHVPGNFAAEDMYQKHVARRMLQMVYTINGAYNSHVQDVGVTCYTCHRGQASCRGVVAGALQRSALAHLAGRGRAEPPRHRDGVLDAPLRSVHAVPLALGGDPPPLEHRA
jgi:photosynthetic reaction center cytochrome c subunit